MDVVVIMMMLETTQTMLASHRHDLLPSFFAATPAAPELRNAPSVMSEEISCCLTVDMFHPIAVSGARYP